MGFHSIRPSVWVKLTRAHTGAPVLLFIGLFMKSCFKFFLYVFTRTLGQVNSTKACSRPSYVWVAKNWDMNGFYGVGYGA